MTIRGVWERLRALVRGRRLDRELRTRSTPTWNWPNGMPWRMACRPNRPAGRRLSALEESRK